MFCLFKVKHSYHIPDYQQPIGPKSAFLVTEKSKTQQNKCDSSRTPIAYLKIKVLRSCRI